MTPTNKLRWEMVHQYQQKISVSIPVTGTIYCYVLQQWHEETRIRPGDHLGNDVYVSETVGEWKDVPMVSR